MGTPNELQGSKKQERNRKKKAERLKVDGRIRMDIKADSNSSSFTVCSFRGEGKKGKPRCFLPSVQTNNDEENVCAKCLADVFPVEICGRFRRENIEIVARRGAKRKKIYISRNKWSGRVRRECGKVASAREERRVRFSRYE